METTTTILQKQHKQQPKYNKKAATTIKEQIQKEQTEIKIQYKQTKQQIIKTLQQNKTHKTEKTNNIITTTKRKTKQNTILHTKRRTHTKMQRTKIQLQPKTNR